MSVFPDISQLAIITSHVGADSLPSALLSWGGTIATFVQNGQDGMLNGYERGFHATQLYRFTILAFFHDDLLIHQSLWFDRVLREFDNPEVGLVGFGAALSHGDPAMYQIPYDYQQLGRSHFLSNMDDAERHGERFAGSCDVAVLDGFSLIVRREILEKAGGWPIKQLSLNGVNAPLHHCYDYWLSCMTRRLGYKIRLVGVSCQHLGGRTFVKLGLGKGDANWQQFLHAHRYIYDEFRDVLPWSVT